jgi:hypothetical protein
MTRGFVKLWRKTLDSGLLQHPTAWQVFGYLLLMANSKPHRRIIAGVMTEAQAGEIVTGRERLADELGLSVQQVRTALNLLKKLEIITVRSTNKYSVISLVNWDRYQQQEPANQPAEPPANQPAPNQRLTTEQELKKNINKSTSYSMSETPDSDGCPPCPHGRILEAYKEILPELTQPRIWRTNQQAALRARWREKWKEGRFKDEDGGVDYFKRFFSFIRESSFLMGKVSGRDGRSFKATLQWFVTASHFDDIVGRKYHD